MFVSQVLYKENENVANNFNLLYILTMSINLLISDSSLFDLTGFMCASVSELVLFEMLTLDDAKFSLFAKKVYEQMTFLRERMIDILIHLNSHSSVVSFAREFMI